VEKIGANSAIIYGPDGEWVGGYRKTHLFETDRTWAKAGGRLTAAFTIFSVSLKFTASGPCFATFHLPPPLNTVSLGICMDLNPQPPAVWSSEDGPYELADYCSEKKCDILLLLNAWLDSNENPEEFEDWDTLSYWIARLRPLWHRDENSGAAQEVELRNRKVVICNRSGEENGALMLPFLLLLIISLRQDLCWDISLPQLDAAIWKTDPIELHGQEGRGPPDMVPLICPSVRKPQKPTQASEVFPPVLLN